jgi:hypothetical protein
LIHPPELSDNPASSHLVAKQEELGKGNYEFGFKVSLTFHKILQHGTDGFTSPLKKGMLHIFIALKNPIYCQD